MNPVGKLVCANPCGSTSMPLVSGLLWFTAARAGVLPRMEHLRGRARAAIIVTGLTTVGATAFFLASVALAGAGRAAVLTATSPLFAVPFSIVFLGESGNWRVVVGTLCSVIGVVLLAQS